MIKNITLTADEALIRKARLRAQEQRKSLNDLFREWLARYVGSTHQSGSYRRLMNQLQHIHPGKKFGREEMNER